jgi:hypothetical protein
VLLLQSVSSFSGTSLDKLSWNTKPCTRRRTSGRPGVARAAKLAPVSEKWVNVGEHCLDNVSNYIFHQIRKPFAKYIPDDWDPLDFLPVNIQSNLQKSEAIVSTSFASASCIMQDMKALKFEMLLDAIGKSSH